MREKKTPPAISVEPLDMAPVQVPYHFQCPISLELMRDPVTVSTGQTYDRVSIESWIATGNISCPVTRSPLTDFTLIPNHTLRRLIQHWCVSNRFDRIPTPKQPADPSSVRSLLHQAASGSNPVQSRLCALRRLKTFAHDSDKNRSLISSLNCRGILLSLLFSESDSADLSDSAELVYESLAVLSLFPLRETESSSIASNQGRVGFLVGLLFDPHPFEVRVYSATLIESVISGTKSLELRSYVSSNDDVFYGVVGILTHEKPSPRALKFGVKTLFALCLSKQNRHKAVSAGAVDALLRRVGELERSDCERALAIVELLCRVPQGCSAFRSHELAVQSLVKSMVKVSDRATEYATGAMLSLCSSSEKIQREAVNAGMLTQLLLLVQSDCTPRAKRKAQMLLKLFWDSWPHDYSTINNSDDFNCSDVVPF